MNIEKSDIIIHAGDICNSGNTEEAINFLSWYSSLKCDKKILIGGNHDFFLEKPPLEIESIMPKNIIYLIDNGININGLEIWGSPFTPYNPKVKRWAFGKKRGKEMKKHWESIPKGIDILITHTPPKGILDLSNRGISFGCESLREQVFICKPKYHVFGHILSLIHI